MDRVPVQIDYATSTDWRELRQTHGDSAVDPKELKGRTGAPPEFGEPISTTIILTLTTGASATFLAWVCKQRKLRRTTLKITVTAPNGEVVTIELCDKRYSEGDGDANLVTDLTKAGLPPPPGG